MKNLSKIALVALLLCAAAFVVSPAFADNDDEFPPGDSPMADTRGENMQVRTAMQMIAVSTKWQIFCTRDAGSRQFDVFSRDMFASDLLRAVVRSQGLVYRVEGNAIYIMTRQEYNQAYGARKVVIPLKYASAQAVSQALKEMLSSKDAKVSGVNDAAAVIIYDTPANIEILKAVVAELDRPLAVAVVQLENVSAGSVANSLQRFLSPVGDISFDEQSNQVIVSDVAGKVAVIEEIALKMDVPSSKETRSFPLTSADCTTVANYLADMFGLQKSAAAEAVIRSAMPEPAAQPPSRPTAPAAQPGGQERSVRDRGRGRTTEVRTRPREAPRDLSRMRRAIAQISGSMASAAAMGTVVADPRTNTVWVTDSPDRLDQIADVIIGLDASLETLIYQFNYADPETLDLETKLSDVLLNRPFEYVQLDVRTRLATITATPEKAARILAMLQQWDAEPAQVFITGKLLSVSHDWFRDIGISYDVLIDNMDNNIGTAVSTSGRFPPVIPSTPKASLTVGSLADDDFNAVLELLESDSTTRILSSPRVLVLDGQEAQFTVTTEEPYTEITVDPNTQTTRESVEFKPVGVTLTVAPRVNLAGTIRMQIAFDVSTLQEIRNGVPVVSRANVQSTVLVADAQPLVIGGLILDQDIDVVDKVPILGDIPLLGMLFRNTRTDRSQREIVLVMIPSIVGSSALAPEPTLSDVEEDLDKAPYLEGESGEGESPAGGGVPRKGEKALDEPPEAQ